VVQTRRQCPVAGAKNAHEPQDILDPRTDIVVARDNSGARRTGHRSIRRMQNDSRAVIPFDCPQPGSPVTAPTKNQADDLLPQDSAAETHRGQRPTSSDYDLAEGTCQ
jgi:hypothetical protein